MDSGDKLVQIIQAAAKRKEKSTRFVHEKVSAIEMFITGILRQRAYLAWTAALTLMHILEIWILIRFHYAYPPPSGLTALRVISSLSLLGLFAALSFKWADFDAQLGQPTHSTLVLRLARIFDSARRVLITGALAAMLVGLWVVVFSKLQLSSPPAFRAVIFSGILGLPIDVTASFLLYLSGTVGSMPVSRRLRGFAFGGTAIALGFLALDLPIPYLFFGLAPRLFLLSSVWRNVSGESLRTLIFLPKRGHDINPIFKRLYKSRLVYSYTTQIFCDFGFLLLFNRLGRFEAGISLLLYLVHKSAHLGMVLFGKTHISLSSGIKSALLIGESIRLRYLIKTLAILGAFYVVLGFAFTPLFLMQRKTMQWLSPTGETMAIDSWLLVIGLLLTANCMLINMATTLAPYRKMKWMLLASALYLCLALFGLWLGPALVHLLSIREALCAFGAIQALCALAMLKLSLAPVLTPFLKGEQPGTQLRAERSAATTNTLCDFLTKAHLTLTQSESGACGLFAVTFFRGKQWEPLEASSIVSSVSQPDDLIAMWGPRTLLIFAEREDPNALHNLHLELIEQLAGFIENIKFCQAEAADSKQLLASLFGSKNPEIDLYELGSNRSAASPSLESAEVLQAVELWHFEPANSKSLSILAKHGLGILRLEGEWSLDSLLPLELRINARRFLRSLFQRQEFLAPDTTNPRDFGGFLHLNRMGRPAALIYIPIEKRESLAAIRYEAFRLNFSDFLGSMSATGLPPLEAIPNSPDYSKSDF